MCYRLHILNSLQLIRLFYSTAFLWVRFLILFTVFHHTPPSSDPRLKRNFSNITISELPRAHFSCYCHSPLVYWPTFEWCFLPRSPSLFLLYIRVWRLIRSWLLLMMSQSEPHPQEETRLVDSLSRLAPAPFLTSPHSIHISAILPADWLAN